MVSRFIATAWPAAPAASTTKARTSGTAQRTQTRHSKCIAAFPYIGLTGMYHHCAICEMAGSRPMNTASSEPALTELMGRKEEIAADLAATVRQSVVRKDTGHAAFHGCIDWHSAVHGAWALTAYARMTGDRQDEALIAT